MLDKLRSSARGKAVKEFQTVFRLSYKKLAGHLASLLAYHHYQAIRVFDPRQLPTFGHDIGDYGKLLKQLADPSSELLEEWLIYTRYIEETIGSLNVLQDFWDNMSGRLPLLNKIAVNYIWMPVTSVDVEQSFSEY